MADIVTGTVSGQVDMTSILMGQSDIRREGVEHTNEIVKESIKGDWNVERAVKDASHAGLIAADASADRTGAALAAMQVSVADRFFQVGRDTADLRAQVIQAIDTTKLATELNSLKGIIEGQRNTTYLSDKIGTDGEKTRMLINDLKYHDLNRHLVERNAELVEERVYGRHWRGLADQNQFGAQFAQLQSQIQNIGSQVQETRQGINNFGTMAGVGQTSSNNNV